jgi:hypothetical protein
MNVFLQIANQLGFKKKNLVLMTASVVYLVRVPGYTSRGQGSIPGTARFSEK